MNILPSSSFGRSLIGRNDVITRLFHASLFMDSAKDLEFLKETGLIRSVISCPKCGVNRSLYCSRDRADKYQWRCYNTTAPYVAEVVGPISEHRK